MKITYHPFSKSFSLKRNVFWLVTCGHISTAKNLRKKVSTAKLYVGRTQWTRDTSGDRRSKLCGRSSLSRTSEVFGGVHITGHEGPEGE